MSQRAEWRENERCGKKCFGFLIALATEVFRWFVRRGPNKGR